MQDKKSEISIEQKNYGIELLRIVSMFMIVLLHVLNKGGVIEATIPLSIKYNILWLIESLCICAVNCYAIISGYVAYKSQHRYSNIIYLWFKVLFYTIGITFIFQIYYPQMVTGKDWVEAFSPVVSGEYWYVTAYVGLFFFMPLLNKAILGMSKKEYQTLLIILFIFFSIIPTLFREDPFKLEFGYSVWWLMILYLLGAYVGKYKVFIRVKTKKIVMFYCGLILCTWSFKIIFEKVTCIYLGEIIGGGLLLDYTSPSIVLASLFLFLTFKRINIKNDYILKVIKRVAPLSFGVYLIHTQDLIWNNWIRDAFISWSNLSIGITLIYILGMSIIIFVFCILLDFLRETIFGAMDLKRRLEKLENRVRCNTLER